MRERGDRLPPGGGELVRLALGEAPRVDLAPRTLGLCRVRGVVTRDGNALPFVTVQLARAAGRKVASAIADRFGHFEFDGLAAGALALTVSHGAIGPVLARRSLELSAGDDHDEAIAVAYGSLAGRVVAASSRMPLAVVRIDVFAADGRVLATTRSDQSGQFKLPIVEAGEWTLGFSRAGESTCKQMPVRVAATQAGYLPEVEL